VTTTNLEGDELFFFAFLGSNETHFRSEFSTSNKKTMASAPVPSAYENADEVFFIAGDADPTCKELFACFSNYWPCKIELGGTAQALLGWFRSPDMSNFFCPTCRQSLGFLRTLVPGTKVRIRSVVSGKDSHVSVAR
jgi:hypothetical protein